MLKKINSTPYLILLFLPNNLRKKLHHVYQRKYVLDLITFFYNFLFIFLFNIYAHTHIMPVSSLKKTECNRNKLIYE